MLTVLTAFLLFNGIWLQQAGAATDVWDGTVATEYADGTGTSTDPYQIATGEQLARLASHVNSNLFGYTNGKYYLLTADIDLNFLTWTPIGTVYSSFTVAFNGTFDGNGHVVSNLSIGSATHASSATYPLGLFGNIHGGTVKNLGVENVAIYGSNSEYIGGLAGHIKGYGVSLYPEFDTPSTVTGCYTTGVISNTETGTGQPTPAVWPVSAKANPPRCKT